ncbi:MAG: IS66 family insertion sequence element accessory protein TnpA, partial [Planctomycetota bacterium]
MSRQTQSTIAQTWKQHFADFERSELTVAQFCHSIGCSTPTFYHWKRKLAESNNKVA